MVYALANVGNVLAQPSDLAAVPLSARRSSHANCVVVLGNGNQSFAFGNPFDGLYNVESLLRVRNLFYELATSVIDSGVAVQQTATRLALSGSCPNATQN